MASWQEDPFVGASVWCLEHGNGRIDYIDYEDSLVYVNYYDNGRHTHDKEDFVGCFDEKLNQFVIAPL